MSDSGNSFGEALESMTTNTKKAIGGTIADFTKSATNQVKGTGGVSVDLFSPDMVAGKNKQVGQTPQGQKPLTQAGQQLAQDPNSKSPEEAAKIQSIEQELKSMHAQYYQDFLAKAEGRDRKTQVEEQQKAQDDQQKQMGDLQKKEEKKAADDATLQRAQRATEVKGGMG